MKMTVLLESLNINLDSIHLHVYTLPFPHLKLYNSMCAYKGVKLYICALQKTQ